MLRMFVGIPLIFVWSHSPSALLSIWRSFYRDLLSATTLLRAFR